MPAKPRAIPSRADVERLVAHHDAALQILDHAAALLRQCHQAIQQHLTRTTTTTKTTRRARTRRKG